MKINQGGKLTEMRRGFIKMLNSYKTIRSLLQKLTNFSFHHINDIDPLILHAQTVKKVQQRSIRHYTELLLVDEVQNKLLNYLNKNDIKIKKYDLYTHVICLLDLLLAKISLFVPKNIDLSNLTPEMMRWKLFLSQLNEAKIAMDLWIRQSPFETPKSRQGRNMMTFYKINATTKINTPSTAYMSMVETPHAYITEKEDMENDKNSPKPFFSYLKRSQSTEKFMGRSLYKRRTQYQLKKKSPQSEGLNDLGFESSIRSPKFLRNGNKNNNKRFDKIEGNNKFSGTMEIIKLKQSNEKCKSLLKKGSIGIELEQVQKLVFEQHPHEAKEFSFGKMQALKKKQDPIIQYRRMNRVQRKTSIRKIKLNQVHTQSTKSDFNLALTKISEDGQQTQLKLSEVQEDEMFQQQELLALGYGNKHKINKRGRNNKKHNFSYDPDAEQAQSQNAIKKKLRKNAQFKANRQSLNSEPSNSVIITQQVPKKSIHDKKRRRNGIINSKQMASVLSRLELKIKQEEKVRQRELKRKTIEMNERLIQELQIGDDSINEEDSNTMRNQMIQKKSFNEFYRELTLLRIDQLNDSKTNPWGQESAFFVMQDFLRDEKSRQLQEYLQQIQMKNRTIGGMFLLKSEDENVKLQNYMMKERKLAFQSQNEKIKNFRKAQFYPTGEVQFIQQKFPSVQASQFTQNI